MAFVLHKSPYQYRALGLKVAFHIRIRIAHFDDSIPFFRVPEWVIPVSME